MPHRKNRQAGAQQWSYDARKAGESWIVIARMIGVSDTVISEDPVHAERTAYKAAWKHAKAHRLQWPLPEPDMTPGYRWTRRDKQKLVDGYAAGISLSDLARDLNRSPKALSAKARVLGIKHPSAPGLKHPPISHKDTAG
jgi:hypothetical protein